MHHSLSDTGAPSCRFSSLVLGRLCLLLFTIALIRCLLKPVAYAATPYEPDYNDPVIESWRWRIFSELQGTGFRCATSDNQGNIWFDIDVGILKYDGLRWQSFTTENGVPRGRVNALCSTGDGAIYTASISGSVVSRIPDGVPPLRRVLTSCGM